MDDFRFLRTPADEAARRLLGCLLVREFEDGRQAVVRIVETEAYDQTDAASHSYRGRTPRTEVMFGPAGHLYVYFTYGMHYCMNIVTGTTGHGSAVLIRAAEPQSGTDVLMAHRDGKQGPSLTNGPAKLCQALQIDKTWNGHDLAHLPLQLVVQPPVKQTRITQTVRVGISRAQDVPWRFFVSNNSYVSRV